MKTSLVLRTSNADGTSHNGFQWPASGPVECPDWNPTAQCGNGLHGLVWGEGDWSLLNSTHDALWQVVEVDTESIVHIDKQKVKFPRGLVVYSGGMAEAITMVLNHEQRFKETLAEIIKAAKKAKTDSSGNSSTSASSGDSSTSASSGDYSTSASSGNSSKSAAKGENTIAMASGIDCTVQAGENGCFASAYYDDKTKRNRILVAHVGEKGIKADTPYRIVDGKWKLAK